MAAGGIGSISGQSRTKSFDVFIPIQQHSSQHVHLQILEGDITKEKTNAMVVFRSDTDIAEGYSLRILQAAGDGVQAEYQSIKAQNGRNTSKGVILTGQGNLEHPDHILHLLVNENGVKFRIALVHALQLVEKQYMRSIAFPHLPALLCSTETIKTMLESFDDFTRMECPICLHFIQVVLANDVEFYQYADARQRVEFDMYRDLLIISISIPFRQSFKWRPRSRIAVGYDKAIQKIQPTTVCILSHRILEHFYPYIMGIHAKLGPIHLHVDSTTDYYHQIVKIAFIDFHHATKEDQWATPMKDAKIPHQHQQLSDIEATHLSHNISIKTAGNQSLFEITIDDKPGKFPRIRSAVHRVLRYAQQNGIMSIVFPSQFEYGDDQIELPEDHWYDEKETQNILPLLYFNAIHDFALYDQPSTPHSIHICTELPRSYESMWHEGFSLAQGKEAGCFDSIFTSLHIDPLFQACQLSVVKETYRITRHRCKWDYDRKEFYLHRVKVTNLDRFTYGRALPQIAPLAISPYIVFTEGSDAKLTSDPHKSSSTDGSADSFSQYKDYIDIDSYLEICHYKYRYPHHICTKEVVVFDNTPQPPPKPERLKKKEM